MRKFIFPFVLALLLSCLSSAAAHSQITGGVIVSVRQSPGTSNRLSFPIAGDLAVQVAPRTILVARGHYSREQKTYRGGSGHAIAFQTDLRFRLWRGLFVSGGLNAGQVSYPDDAREAGYTKRSFALRSGVGWYGQTGRGWYSFHYSYLWPDQATFDHGLSNRIRGHEIGADGCFNLSRRLCVGPHFQYRRLSFVQPYNPALGWLHASQTTIGLRIGWRKH